MEDRHRGSKTEKRDREVRQSPLHPSLSHLWLYLYPQCCCARRCRYRHCLRLLALKLGHDLSGEQPHVSLHQLGWHTTIAEHRDEVIEPHFVPHAVDLLQTLVRGASHLEADEAIDALLWSRALGIVRDHTVVFVALDVLEVSIREMVVRISRAPVPAHVLTCAFACLFLRLSTIDET